MTTEEKNEIKAIIREEFKKLVPEFFGKTLNQLRNFFISTIN
jgi:hypothetical protein|tara:strand:- start:2590 stop:2715 length:126 start_codon:yes stop_codon:yes gene_type:complete